MKSITAFVGYGIILLLGVSSLALAFYWWRVAIVESPNLQKDSPILLFVLFGAGLILIMFGLNNIVSLIGKKKDGE